MKTQVVALHRDNDRHPNHVYIGRRGVGLDWKWGNPFRDGTRDRNVDRFLEWLRTGESFGNSDATPERRKWMLDNVHHLRGQTLVCFCKPRRCHGDVLAELADNPQDHLMENCP